MSEEEGKAEEKNGPLKLDNKDKDILNLLNENARITSKNLGSGVGISREVADYRIKRLSRNGLIKNYITIVNDSKLGFDAYLLLLQMQNYSVEEEQRIVDALVAHPFTKWVLRGSGEWDLQVAIAARNKHHLAQVVDEIDNVCGKSLRKYDLALVVNLLKSETLAFLLRKEPKAEIPKPPSKEVVVADLDDKDKQLLKALSENGRMPIVKIANQIGLSADATNLRIKKLVKQGIIKKFQTVIDLSRLDYLLYSVYLKINNYSSQRESQIQTFLHTLPNLTFAERILGSWDIRVQISVATAQQFEDIMRKIRAFLSEDLKYYNATLMMKEYKRVSYTKGMAE